jgi:HEAT repeat protein
MAYRDVMTELADLLGDESEQARIMAARAIAYAGRPEGQLLLRLKIRTGDKSPTVTAECLIALANLARAKALPFIQGYLDALDPTVAEGAAMAIGEMRDPTALALLTERWNHDGFAESRMALALPIALSRLPQSIDFLLAALPDVAEPVAARILEALRIYRHDTAITQRIRTGVDSRSAPALTATFHKFFPA